MISFDQITYLQASNFNRPAQRQYFGSAVLRVAPENADRELLLLRRCQTSVCYKFFPWRNSSFSEAMLNIHLWISELVAVNSFSNVMLALSALLYMMKFVIPLYPAVASCTSGHLCVLISSVLVWKRRIIVAPWSCYYDLDSIFCWTAKLPLILGCHRGWYDGVMNIFKLVWSRLGCSSCSMERQI